jgi:hypothetical protein
LKHFYDTARAKLFAGSLTQGQVDGMGKIVAFGQERGTSREDLAYLLATVFHETARWMQPIREGARRYGLDYTDAQSRRAVESIYSKGVISWNYALPDANGNSFYGRGLLQITHKENYAKFEDACDAPLALHPDLVLDWDNALIITFLGMEDGMFRSGHSLLDVDTVGMYKDFVRARGIINGDVRKNGAKVAKQAMSFYDALAEYTPANLQECHA